MQPTIKLKTVLQSNLIYYILFIFIIIYIIINTILITYDTNISNFESIIGTVTDITYQDEKMTFILVSNKEKIICNYYSKNYINLLGKKVIITGERTTINNNTIPNNFNYKKYLYNNKIYVKYNVNNIKIIKKENIFYKLKNLIIKRINTFSNKIKPYLNLFILGENDYLDKSIANIYRTNGIWHLFAISGMHVSIIIILFNKVFKKLKYRNILISIFLLYFVFLTNYSLSVIRVVLYYILKNILAYYDIKISSIRILLLCAFLLLLINPFNIFNVAFQYSFLVSASLILMNKRIKGNYFKKIILISFISFIVSLPITINLNYEINLSSIFLNIFYVPFISFLIFPISIISFLFPLLSKLLEILITFLEFTNKIIYNLKLTIVIPKIPFIIIIIYYLAIYFIYKKNKKSLYFLLLFLLIINKIIYKLDNNFYIYYLDVGQGDSSIIISPFKKEVIMIDTGGNIYSNYHISDNIIIFLKSLGIKKVDSLILSHGDYDHMGESINIVNNFKIDKVFFNCGNFNNLENNLIDVLKKKNISFYSCYKQLEINDKKLYFINNKNYNNENDNSIVTYTKLGSYQFLFMGDASINVEQDLINKYKLNNIDVLKVGHHGSKTSSDKEFINEIKPKYSIISVGKNNRYGHPDKETLDNLQNSTIYRTDLSGSIMIKIKNDKLKIKEYMP